MSRQQVKDFQADIDTDPAFYSYFGHIVSEIKQFYPDEYEMLEILASGQTDDFIELSHTNEFIQHLLAYGLISYRNNIPVISLPVAGKYIAVELAKHEGRKIPYKLVCETNRKSWISHRIDMIIETMRNFEDSIRLAKKPLLYGLNSFSEAEKLKVIPEAYDENSFSIFINTFYRCFVESISNYGQSIKDSQYFQNTIHSNYPTLYRTLDKIKEYRNERDHLLLTEFHKKKLDEYRAEDLEAFDTSKDKLFCIQQKIIIELLTSIYSETLNLE